MFKFSGRDMLIILIGFIIMIAIFAQIYVPGGVKNFDFWNTDERAACYLFANSHYNGEYRMDGATCMINTPAGWLEKEAARQRWIANGGKP